MCRQTALGAVLALPFMHHSACAAEEYREVFRPQFHFTPGKNWMNDPNGLVFHDGEYHLFYQYNPEGDKWGHMSWGHAVSGDLTRWEHLPVALPEQDGIMMFSGSAVVDRNDTSGFGRDGEPALVAIYTGHREGREDQRLAYSRDRGRSWTQFSGNPVLDIDSADFRDPKVFWYQPTKQWIMVVALAVERKVCLYSSPDLKDWSRLGDFGPAGSVDGLWECPDLFELPVEGEPDAKKWVLVVNVNPGAPAGGSGCQYFVGDFDGQSFKPEGTVAQGALWADYGPDFYAAVSWSAVPAEDGRRIWLGWMSNWTYAQDAPTSPWRGAMTVPRVLTLHRTPDGVRLAQEPVAELEKLNGGPALRFSGGNFSEAAAWLAEQKDLTMLLDVTMSFSGLSGQTPFTIGLRTAQGEQISIVCDPARGKLVLDRTRSGLTEFHSGFAGSYEAPLCIEDETCALRLLLDTSSLEVFAQEGKTVLSALIYPTPGSRSFSLSTGEGDGPQVSGITIQPLKSIW